MSAVLHSQVVIVGAGPAGLMLSHLLQRSGIESIVLERESAGHVVNRVRAGVLEQGTVDLMREAGVAGRLDREGMRHHGLYLSFDRVRHHLDFEGRTGGRAITVYGQNEIVRDLLDARESGGRSPIFGVTDVQLHGLTSVQPRVTFVDATGAAGEIACDFIAGCDGFHGVSRRAMPAGVARMFERTYPFAWLGVLAEAPPSSGELIYSLHDRGFALFSMRSPSVTRLYLQVSPNEALTEWSDDRIWNELRARLETADGWRPNEGRITQKSLAGMRSFMVEPMQYGRLFLAGDAAHIVPPTGAKGLNLAMADVKRLATALAAFYSTGRTQWLETYSARGLRRAWRAQRFSWWMTSTLHVAADATPFDRRRQLADLEYLVSSEAAMTSLAESYVGTVFD